MSLTDSAIEAIKQMIVSGELKPGDRLPREADLAQQLGLSRNSLREAVKALELIRVLDVRQGDGTYVTASMLEFVELRRLLEPGITAIAAMRMSSDEAAALGALLDELPPDPDVEALVANDAEFHRRIAASSGNALVCSLLETVSSHTQRARVWRGLTEADAVTRTVAEHRAIQQAIARRDPATAEAWARVHIAGVEDWLRAR